VVAVNDTRLGVAAREDQSVAVYSLDPVGEPLDVVVTDGRLPSAEGEVTLGPSTADRLRVGIGDSVRLVGTRGEHEFAVTGLAFVPQSPHDIYSSGAWVTSAGYDRLFEGFKFHIAAIQLRPGADRDAVAARLQQSIGAALGDDAGGGEFVTQPLVPDQLAELRQVRRFPVFLACFLAVLALGAVGHALASAVRRRRHDIAVLRVLGLTRRESRLIVITQALVLALVGLVVGTPLGVVVGRIVWERVADRTPVDYVPPVAVWALMLIAPIALAAANLLAAWPSHRAATLRVAPVLRSE
jgi:predicted lysophospholipase L1 biosynthesis ABC-type transport system permease subunit